MLQELKGLKVRRESKGSEPGGPRSLDSVSALTRFPNLHLPWNHQNPQFRASMSWLDLMSPFLYTCPRSLVCTSCIPDGTVIENWVGLLLSLCNPVGQRHCPSVRKNLRRSCAHNGLLAKPVTYYMFPETLTARWVLIHPTSYKNTLDSLNVYVKY